MTSASGTLECSTSALCNPRRASRLKPGGGASAAPQSVKLPALVLCWGTHALSDSHVTPASLPPIGAASMC
jgi:hypothetical protein